MTAPTFKVVLEDNRLGTFSVSTQFFKAALLGGWRGLLPLFDNVVVMCARPDLRTDTVEYTAFHPAFDHCPPGGPVPRYECVMHKSGNLVTTTWKRLN